jgi:hypothetical protein
MACDNLTLGRIEPCKDSVGGIKNIYFVNYGDLTPVYDATDTDVIDSVGSDVDAYKYEVRSTASTFTQNIQSSRDAGTTAFEQVLEITLKKLSIDDHKELKLLSYSRPHVVVEDNNGNLFLAGLEYGMDVTGGTIVTGGAMADLSGYTLSLTGMEKVPANFLGGSMATVGFTVVSGS